MMILYKGWSVRYNYKTWYWGKYERSHVGHAVYQPVFEEAPPQYRPKALLFLDHGATTLVGQGILIIEDSWSDSETPHSLELLWTSDQPDRSVIADLNKIKFINYLTFIYTYGCKR